MFSKRTIIAISLAVLIFLPAVAKAAASLPPEQNPICWKKSECETARKSFTLQDSTTAGAGFVAGDPPCIGGSGSDAWGKCLPAGVAVTEISFGGQSQFANMGVFIVTVYNYAVRIAAILAVIMIILAGVQWMTAGGNSEGITSAKKRITGAVVGLLIAYMSFFVLNSINPALVSLRLPQTWMVKGIGLTANVIGQDLKEGDTCYTIRDKDSCKGNPDMYCIPLKKVDEVNSRSCFEIISRYTQFGVEAGITIGTLGSGGAGLAVAKTAGSAIANTGWLATKSILGLSLKKGIIGSAKSAGKRIAASVLVGGAAIVGSDFVKATKNVDPAWGDEGVCMILTQGTVPNNGLCADDSNCQSGKCSIPQAECVGFCTDGGNNSACSSNDDCTKTGNCVKISGNSGFCTDGKLGSLCMSKDDCYDKSLNPPCTVNPSTGWGKCGGTIQELKGDCPSGQYRYVGMYTPNEITALQYYTPDENPNTCHVLEPAGSDCWDKRECAGGNCVDSDGSDISKDNANTPDIQNIKTGKCK